MKRSHFCYHLFERKTHIGTLWAEKGECVERYPKHVGVELSDEVIGAYLKKYRKECGMTAKEVGDIFRVSAQAIYNMESGRNHVAKDVLLHMLSIYGIDPDDAFKGPTSIVRERSVGSARAKRIADGFSHLSDEGQHFVLSALDMALKAEGCEAEGGEE